MNKRANIIVIVLGTLLLASPFLAERTRLRPGLNIFSAEQDVEIGKQVSREAERQLKLVQDAQATSYANRLAQALISRMQTERYPYQVKVVDDRGINAFALPGGFLYINRGVFETADNEGQFAGVLAHEISHVALRHGTNQLTKSYVAQAPLALIGGLVGGDSFAGILARMGVSLAANSVLLKFSRDAEQQADLLGAQTLYDANYDPRAMVKFFEKLQASEKGRGSEFFSSHPNPGNRIGYVNQEIEKLGGARRGYRHDTAEFQRIKRRLKSN